MDKRKSLLILIFILSILLINACKQQTKHVCSDGSTVSDTSLCPKQTQPNQDTISTAFCGDGKCDSNEKYSNCKSDCKLPELTKLILQKEDLPQDSGYELLDSGPRSEVDVSADALRNGWKEGYKATFTKKVGTNSVYLTDYLSVYEEGKGIINLETGQTETFKEKVKTDDYGNALVIEQLPDPKIGLRSYAFKRTIKYSDGSQISIYAISFTKSDVLHNISGTEYALVLDIAKKLDNKI